MFDGTVLYLPQSKGPSLSVLECAVEILKENAPNLSHILCRFAYTYYKDFFRSKWARYLASCLSNSTGSNTEMSGGDYEIVRQRNSVRCVGRTGGRGS